MPSASDRAAARMTGNDFLTMPLACGRLALAAVAATALAGCVGLPSSTDAMRGSYFDRQGIDVVLAPSEAQTNYFKDPPSRERYCRSPPSDVAVTLGEGFGVGLGLPVGAQKSVTEDASRGALALGGRNPGVLITRELMYRACELSLNLNADTALTMRIYERFLQAAEGIAKAQIGTGVAAQAGTAGDTRVAPLTAPAAAQAAPDSTTPVTTTGTTN